MSAHSALPAGKDDADPTPTHVDRGSPLWRGVFRAAYFVVRRANRVTRLLVGLRVSSFDNEIVELALTGRRTGRPRTVLVTLIRVGGSWYVGHPNGETAWIANLLASRSVQITLPRQLPVAVRPVALPLGPERDAVILETGRQQPSPARPLYRAARRHILRAGIYVRLEPLSGPPGAETSRARFLDP